jgi:hypothetical protein
MKVEPILATETMIKYLLYMNGLFLIVGIFSEYDKISAMIFLGMNFVILLLRQGIKKESSKIEYRASITGSN